jgi:hypothetical protein
MEQDRGRTAGSRLIDQPVQPVAVNKRVTLPDVTHNRATTSVFDRRSAQASTIFARTANRADSPCDHRSSCARSASVNTNSARHAQRGHPENMAT